jgi:hypothetical protein
MRVPKLPLSAPFALVLLLAFSAHALSLVEGRIPGSGDGAYDFLIDVWDQPAAPDAKPRLIQTILVSRVAVAKGRFKIALDTGLDTRKEGEITFGVRCRPFETLGAYRAGEVSHVDLASL